MSLCISTWNVNSIKARLPHLLQWLETFQPHIALLQEIKVVTESFPSDDVADLGYNVCAVGQKTYNGVAILSKSPIDLLHSHLPGDPEDRQARYVEAFTAGLRVASIYVPNGNPVESDKFAYKLMWLDRLASHVVNVLASADNFIIGGDFNIAPEERDVHDPPGWRNDALCRPEARAAWRKIRFLGLTDAVRSGMPTERCYTWWDYRRGAWPNDEGLRIDHLLLSPGAADRLEGAGVDRVPRGWDRPSDHAPVWCRLED